MHRRTFFALLTATVVLPHCAVRAVAQGAGMTRVTAYAFSFKALKSGDIRLSDYVGKPILVVNTASLCDTRRNIPACRPCGRATATKA